MHKLKFLLFIFLFASCVQKSPGVHAEDHSGNPKVGSDSITSSSNKFGIDTVLYDLKYYPIGEYRICKSAGITKRNAFATQYNQASDSVKKEVLNAAGKYLTEHIVNEIMPFWYDTPWTFEGHTDVPGEGTVACGYLVSTTLKHAGLNLNRYKFAQKAGLAAAKSLALSGKIKTMTNCTREAVKAYFIKEKPDGLYFVGLDCHVGYLLKRKGELFFIHSNYINKVGVMIEIAEKSRAFSSRVYCIADITSNEPLMECWVNNREIKIVD